MSAVAQRAKAEAIPILTCIGIDGYRFAPPILQNKNSGELPRRFEISDPQMNLDQPHIQHARQLGERQRRGADQRCNQRRETAIAVALAAHLAGDPL